MDVRADFDFNLSSNWHALAAEDAVHTWKDVRITHSATEVQKSGT